MLYILLAPHGNEQWDLIHRISGIRELETIPEYKNLLELFINEEVILWNETIVSNYQFLREVPSKSPAAKVTVFVFVYSEIRYLKNPKPVIFVGLVLKKE